MYDYGSQDMALFIFTTPTDTFIPSIWFRSGIGNWEALNTKFVVAGDFNNDGNNELSALYDYGSQDTAQIVFTSNGSSFTNSTWYRSGRYNWSVTSTMNASAGDYFGNGIDEISTMYDYGLGDMAVVLFK